VHNGIPSGLRNLLINENQWANFAREKPQCSGIPSSTRKPMSSRCCSPATWGSRWRLSAHQGVCPQSSSQASARGLSTATITDTTGQGAARCTDGLVTEFEHRTQMLRDCVDERD
jgi:hypothetical protein